MKVFYDTGEVAEMLDIQASTVRYWAEKFKLRGLHKTTSGRRKFSPADVERMKDIYHLVREKGLTIEGAQARLKGGGERVSHDQELMSRLLGVRALLEEIREELNCSHQRTITDCAPTVARRAGEASCAGGKVESEQLSTLNSQLSTVEAPSLNPAIVEQTLF